MLNPTLRRCAVSLLLAGLVALSSRVMAETAAPVETAAAGRTSATAGAAAATLISAASIILPIPNIMTQCDPSSRGGAGHENPRNPFEGSPRHAAGIGCCNAFTLGGKLAAPGSASPALAVTGRAGLSAGAGFLVSGVLVSGFLGFWGSNVDYTTSQLDRWFKSNGLWCNLLQKHRNQKPRNLETPKPETLKIQQILLSKYLCHTSTRQVCGF